MKLRKAAKFLKKVKENGLYSKKTINIVEKVLVYFLTYKNENGSDIAFVKFSHDIILNLNYDDRTFKIVFSTDTNMINLYISRYDSYDYSELNLTLDELFNCLNNLDNFPK